MNIIIYKIVTFIYGRILRKDIMNLKIKRFRKLGVKIGNNMRAFSDPFSKEPYLLEFGDNVTISTNVTFITHDNSIVKALNGYTDIFGKIKIGSNCFIGHGCIILPGVELASNIIVAAGSIVTKSFLTENIIIGGNPARIINNFDVFINKYKDYAFNISGKNKNQVKHEIQNNINRLIKR